MLSVAARGLAPHGRFVFSAHHYGLGARLRRVTKDGYYGEGGIYRYFMTREEVERETTVGVPLLAVRA